MVIKLDVSNIFAGSLGQPWMLTCDLS